MDNYLCTIPSSRAPNYSEDCKDGQKVKLKITDRQDTVLIGTLVLLIIFLIALVTFPPSAMSASCEKECCKGSSVQGDSQKCCQSSCNCNTMERGSDKVQPGQDQRYKDVKCYNACVKSGYRCKYCEDNCSYCK
jgi:hypothetical protein